MSLPKNHATSLPCGHFVKLNSNPTLAKNLEIDVCLHVRKGFGLISLIYKANQFLI